MNRISLIEAIRYELRELSNAEISRFVAAFNNEGYKRVRNRTPRTDLMLKNSIALNKYHEHGFIPNAAYSALHSQYGGLITREWFFSEISYDRYIDIGVITRRSDWWQGQAAWELIIEIENNFNELYGTIRDLLNIQAKRKWGIFYHDNPSSIAEDLKDCIEKVFDSFHQAQFVEHKSTLYEIIILPNKLSNKGLVKEKVLSTSFLSLEENNKKFLPVEVIEL